MITIKEIEKIIQEYNVKVNDILNDLKSANVITAKKLTRDLKAHQKALKEYKICKAYLETNPREEFIRSEYKRLTELLDKIESRREWWKKNSGMAFEYGDDKKRDAAYNSINDIKNIKRQIDILNFILN